MIEHFSNQGINKSPRPGKRISLSFCYSFTFLFFLSIYQVPYLAQSPGGYSTDLKFWVKANAGTFSDAGVTSCTNNTTLQQWNDQSGLGFNATQSSLALKPTFFTNAANGNPVLRFGGTHFVDVASLGISGTSDYYGFVVVKLTSATAGGPNDGNGSYVIDRTTATNELFDIKVISSGGTNRYFFQKRNDGGGNLGGPTSVSVIDPNGFQLVGIGRIYNSSSNSLSQIYVNGLLEDTQTNGSETTTPPPMRIGRHATNATGGMVGDLAEVIVYNNNPSSTDRQKIESYLAVKYGFSVDQSTMRNYFSSNGTVIYPATTTHSNYITTITGIGMDNVSGLSQSNSRNQSTNDFIRMQNPSALSNGDFLLWGNNNASMVTPNTVDVDGITVLARLSRVWRIAHIGAIGAVDMTIDLSAVPGTKSQADLRLLIDRDGDGFFDNDVTPLSGTLVGNDFTVSGVNFQNGDYFTIGSTNLASTPLPVELIHFAANCEDEQINISWSTASEKNSDYFILERSNNAEHWVGISHIKTDGNSSVIKNYSYTDVWKDESEVYYYRLSQADKDGKKKEFKIISVSCDNTVGTLLIYPNPAGSEITLELNMPLMHGSTVVKILSSSGKICKEQKMQFSRGTSSTTLPLDLAPGVYNLLLYSDELVLFTKRLVVKE